MLFCLSRVFLHCQLICEQMWVASQKRDEQESHNRGPVAAVIKNQSGGVNSPTAIGPLRHLPETNCSEGRRRGLRRDAFRSAPRRQLVVTAHGQTRLLPLFNFRRKVTPNGCRENGKLWSDSLPKFVRCVTLGEGAGFPSLAGCY